MEKMNLNLAATSTFCDEKPAIHCPYPAIPQASYDQSKLSSPSNSPPSSPPSIGILELAELGSTMVSEEDGSFPVTPDSKQSGGKHRPTADISESHHHESDSHTTSTRKDQEALSRAIKDMSLHTFHCAIHYKEVVRETLRMEYLYRGWLLETSRRLNIFNESLHHEMEMEFWKVDQELQWLVHVLVDQGGLTHTTNDDVQYVTAARDSSGKALVDADAEIDIFKQFSIGDTDDRDNKSELEATQRVTAVL
ncbi:uncharacterized protein EDB93DRAFT_1099729 [Suillus bovinus]|uniref:uncharacterized protein n=1 Tax=Suillus bovinus TaxID=48563 RepID=UPI001B868D12|nr:uncharacterized protein EDB93DRAFT_1099729 [Suillus bovinus]KAG2159348.1 hypothetical protein EDB93DRAFT_1099729 [Suillus bovinus]